MGILQKILIFSHSKFLNLFGWGNVPEFVMTTLTLLAIFSAIWPLSSQTYQSMHQFTTQNFCRAKQVDQQSSDVLDTQLEYLWYELYHHLPRTFTAVERARLVLDQKRWRLVSTSIIGGSFSNYALVSTIGKTLLWIFFFDIW